MAVRVRFVVDKVTLDTFLLQALRFSLQYLSTNVPHFDSSIFDDMQSQKLTASLEFHGAESSINQ